MKSIYTYTYDGPGIGHIGIRLAVTPSSSFDPKPRQGAQPFTNFYCRVLEGAFLE
jgi:hypothetical protein